MKDGETKLAIGKQKCLVSKTPLIIDIYLLCQNIHF